MSSTTRADEFAKLGSDTLAPIATIVEGDIHAGNIAGAMVKISRLGSEAPT